MKLLVGSVLGVLGLSLLPAGTGAAATVTPDNFEVMLVVDTSGSMNGAPIDLAKQAATTFVDQLSQVRVGLESFGASVEVLTPPTADHDLVKARLGSLTATGETHLHDALITASQQFTPAGENKAIVLLSDGGDEGSVATLDDAVTATQGIDVEVISLTTSRTDLGALQRLGTVTSADDPTALAGTFARMADQLTQVVVPTVPATAAPTSVPPTEPPTTAVATTTAATVPPTTIPAPATPEHVSSLGLWLGVGGVAVAIFTMVLLAFPNVRVKRQRLGIEKDRPLANVSQRTSEALDGVLERYGKRRALSTSLAAAGFGMRAGEFASLVLAITAVVALAGLAFVGPWLAVIGAVVTVLVARWLVTYQVNKRQTAFSEQLPEVLKLLTSALRTGYGLNQALDAVVQDAEEPARTEFERVLTDVRLGRDMAESMTALAQRMESEDLRWVVAAIAINRETGGNLSEILNTVGATVRERQQSQRQVRTLTAEGRLSARVLTGLPFLLAFWQWRANPDNFAVLTKGFGLVLLGGAGILLLFGWLWINRIVRIKL